MRISDWSSDVCSSDLQDSQPFGIVAQHVTHAEVMHRKRALPRSARALIGIGRGGDRLEIDLRRIDQLREFAIGAIGRASCRARVWPYVLLSVVAVLFNTKTIIIDPCHTHANNH